MKKPSWNLEPHDLWYYYESVASKDSVHELSLTIDSDGKLDAKKITVWIDGLAIGCLQDLKIHLNADGRAEISVTYPDTTNSDVDESYLDNTFRIEPVIKCLQQLGISVIREPMCHEELREIGTDGVIDSIPLK